MLFGYDTGCIKVVLVSISEKVNSERLFNNLMFSNLISINCWSILIISASKTSSDDGRIAPNLTPDFTSLTLEINNSFFEDSSAFFS